MESEITCRCGKALLVSRERAGSSVTCDCGYVIPLLALDGGGEEADTSESAPPVLELLEEEPPRRPRRPAEVLAPTEASLLSERNGRRPSTQQVMVALTDGALWVQEVWRLRQVPLSDLDMTAAQLNARELTLTLRPEVAPLKLVLTFGSAAEAHRWYWAIQEQPPLPPDDRTIPAGVSLVGQAPELRHEDLGPISFTARSRRAAERGLQLRAAMRGADAVIGVTRRRCPDRGWHACEVSGLAIRTEDADDQNRLRWRWYAEKVNPLTNRILICLTLLASLLFLVTVFGAKVSTVDAPTGETPSEAAVSGGLGVGLLFAWPFLLAVLLRVMRWPQLLRGLAVATLAATTIRGLTVGVAHLAAAWSVGASQPRVWVLLDPFDWAFIIAGAFLSVRAWRLACDAPDILPPDDQADPATRRNWSHGLLAVSVLHALFVLGSAGYSRFESSSYALQPGVDPRREQEGLHALNEGVVQSEKGNLLAAERSWQRARAIWEDLAARPSAPAHYRVNLATTLCNLGWLRDRQGRFEEARAYIARAVEIDDGLAGTPDLEAEYRSLLADARRYLAGVDENNLATDLEARDAEAVRKYEEAQVKAGRGEPEAAGLFQQAITLWEAVLSQATEPAYLKGAHGRLAAAYLTLAEVQSQEEEGSRAEAALEKSIAHGEKAVALAPDRPLYRHNLELARRMLDQSRERTHQKEITRLYNAQRYAEAAEVCQHGVEELEAQVRSGKDRDSAVRLLASRLDRHAWLLAHCPDPFIRDTKAAIRQARRAVELQPKVGGYWYTLALVQYRHGTWQDSLTSLEHFRSCQEEFDATAWFLTAMNRHQLKQRDEARAAMKNAVDWINTQLRKAEDDALLRFRYELMRPAIEELRREAEMLLQGKDPANQGVG